MKDLLNILLNNLFPDTWVDEESIQRLLQEIAEGYFRGPSGLSSGDVGRFVT